jgi:hypothetical protein
VRPSKSRHEAAQDIKLRASEAPDSDIKQRCAVPGCQRLVMRAAGAGVSENLCRAHVEHKARHGSIWRKSLSAAQLKPYRKAAARWLEAIRTGPSPSDAMLAREAERRVDTLLSSAGPVVFVRFLADEPPEGRARQTAEVVAVMAALRGLEVRDPEYSVTQIGKAVHRMAGGYRQVMSYSGGKARLWQWHPEPRGHMLRSLGRMVRGAVEHGFGPQEVAAIAALANTPTSK